MRAVGGRVGLYDVTPDWHPLLGPVDGLRGLHLATGGSGHCFKLAPAIGELVAGAILGAARRLRRRRELLARRASPRAASSRRATAGTAHEPLDLVIRNGTVYDGTGAERRSSADVAIADGRIAAVGAVDAGRRAGARRGRPRRRARVHRHPQPLRLHAARRPARARARSTRASRSRWSATAASAASRSATPSSRARRSTATTTRCRSTGRRPAATSTGSSRRGRRSTCSASCRTASCGSRPSASPTGRPTPPSSARMRRAAPRVARRGRVGLLDRPRVRAGVGRARGGDHGALLARSTGSSTRRTRARATRAQFESVEEAIRTAERAEARLQVSHLVPRNGIDEARRSIELVERARDRGLDVEFDMHTRRFGITHLYAALPPWALGAPTTSPRCSRDPAARDRMRPHRSILSAGERLVADRALRQPVLARVRAPRPRRDRRRARPGAARRRLRPAASRRSRSRTG